MDHYTHRIETPKGGIVFSGSFDACDKYIEATNGEYLFGWVIVANYEQPTEQENPALTKSDAGHPDNVIL